MDLLKLFCAIDDFCQALPPSRSPQQLSDGLKHRHREGRLCLSEVMTIVILFHQSGYRTFKDFYVRHVRVHLWKEFPGLVSYNRFVERMPSTLMPLCAYLRQCYGACTGVSFVDATPLRVCHTRRIHQHRVFEGVAQRGKTSTGWFFGFKLHLLFNDRGELLQVALTAGNVDDRKPLPKMVRHLFGKLFADKGYLSEKLHHDLLETFGIELITKIKANMKNRLLPWRDKILLRKRAIVETIIDQLKNISQIEHSRHRSGTNFLVNLLGGLIAYCHQPKKPSLNLEKGTQLTPA